MFARIAAAALAMGLLGSNSPTISSETKPIHPWVTACENWDEWDKPGPPFQVYANTYYVGTCGISAILITGTSGHVLIDSGTAAGADIVAANIKKLGFKLTDVNILLQSHEHFDHVGGLAKLQQLTGAELIASKDAALVLTSGKASSSDPQFGTSDNFQPARVDAVLEPGKPVVLGNLALTPIATPGHTPGALSWTWQSCEVDDCRSVVYADSLSPVSNESYRFSDHPEYLAAFRASIEKIRALPCRILLTPHPSASSMRELLQGGNLSSQFGLPCDAYARSVAAKLQIRLLEEAQQK